MKVKELMNVLSKCDPNAEICSNDLCLRPMKLLRLDKINQADCYYDKLDKNPIDNTNQSKVNFIWAKF